MSATETRRAVAIGGGTGLPQVLRCLVELGFDTTAIVTMADDGGSSGVLRQQLGILPPGDVRNCLVALASDEESVLANVFQYRFGQGEGLAGHALGNLILAALCDLTGDFATAIEIAGTHLGVRGRVLPSTLADVELHGVDRAGAEVFGQARLAANATAVERAFLEPEDPPAFPEALLALSEADVIVIGPGSLYTSIIPNFLVAGIGGAVRASSAARVYVCNVANMRGETAGLDAAEHVQALFDHGLEGAIDRVLVHDNACAAGAVCDDEGGAGQVGADASVVARIRAMGPDVLVAPLADPDDPLRHDHARLRGALEEVLG